MALTKLKSFGSIFLLGRYKMCKPEFQMHLGLLYVKCFKSCAILVKIILCAKLLFKTSIGMSLIKLSFVFGFFTIALALFRLFLTILILMN